MHQRKTIVVRSVWAKGLLASITAAAVAAFIAKSSPPILTTFLSLRHTCDQPKSVSFSLSFATLTLPGEVTVEGADTLVLRGHAFEHMHSNGKQGLAFETRIRVLPEGGRVTAGDSALQVKDADAVTLHVAIATDFRGSRRPCALHAEACKRVHDKTYEQLRSAHVKDHQIALSSSGNRSGTQPGQWS